MKYIALVVVLAALGGCVSASPTVAPDGKPAFAVSCNGGIHTIADCYQKASEVCHGPYDIIGGESGSNMVITGNQYGVYGGGVEKRTIVVECK